ncbi:MAG: Type secretion outer membrane protein TolC [Rickettsiaceae bacterium]|jgi:TolC family type I secretion outer membrane protein|nr:Type secretion outer membrane protein TolC [Rickettsiaceae bacterium]
MKKKFLTFFIASLASASAFSMDLHEALTSAYKNNSELKLKREEYLRTIEQYPQALAEFMPKIAANLSKSKGSTKDHVPTPLGDHSTKHYGKTIKKAITLEQPLFNGGGSVAGLQAAKLAYLAAKSTLESEEQHVFLKVIESYLKYIEAQENYDVADKSVKAFVKHLEATEQKYKLGESTKTEVAQAKSALAGAKAEKAVSYARLQAQKADFRNIIGAEPVSVKMPSLPNDLPVNFDSLLSKSKSNHPDISAVKYTAEAQKYGTYTAKSSLLPSASLALRAENDRNRTKRKADPEDLRSRKRESSRSATVSLHIPIFEKGGAEYSKIRQQKSKARAAALSHESAVESLIKECIATWEGHIATKERVNLVKDQVAAASLALEGVKQEEALGNKTVLDVLNAQNELYKAQIASIQAKKENVFMAYKIQSLLGTLTAQAMKLKVDKFDAEQEFNKIKHKLIGY